MSAPFDVEAVRRGAEQPVRAGAGELDAVAADLAAAFRDDPMLDWFMRSDPRRTRARQALFRTLVRERFFPTGMVERPAAGGAAALWIASEQLAPTPRSEELRTLPLLLYVTGLARFPRIVAIQQAMAAHHPHAPHDYLGFLGVHPALQGRGVGSRLISAHLVGLDGRGRAAFLETATPRNVALYRRHGFEVTGEFRPGGTGPTMWTMWRDPR